MIVPLPKNNLIQRVMTAFFLMPLVLALLFLGPLWLKQGVVVCLALGLTHEWMCMTGVGFSEFITIFYKRKIFVLGHLYILSAMIILFSLVEHPKLLLWMLIVIWLNDSFAYFSGRLLGGPKLCPKISPKKTWSGFIGGVVVGSVFAGMLAMHLELMVFPYGVSFLLSLAGHGGDLLESAVKRYYNVKDSGQLLPGHGGLLDRLDSLLAVCIVFQCLESCYHIVTG